MPSQRAWISCPNLTKYFILQWMQKYRFCTCSSPPCISHCGWSHQLHPQSSQKASLWSWAPPGDKFDGERSHPSPSSRYWRVWRRNDHPSFRLESYSNALRFMWKLLWERDQLKTTHKLEAWRRRLEWNKCGNFCWNAEFEKTQKIEPWQQRSLESYFH